MATGMVFFIFFFFPPYNTGPETAMTLYVYILLYCIYNVCRSVFIVENGVWGLYRKSCTEGEVNRIWVTVKRADGVDEDGWTTSIMGYVPAKRHHPRTVRNSYYAVVSPIIGFAQEIEILYNICKSPLVFLPFVYDMYI